MEIKNIAIKQMQGQRDRQTKRRTEREANFENFVPTANQGTHLGCIATLCFELQRRRNEHMKQIFFRF